MKVFGPSEEGPESHPIRLHAASFVFAYVNDHVRCPSEANEDSEVCGRLISRLSKSTSQNGINFRHADAPEPYWANL